MLRPLHLDLSVYRDRVQMADRDSGQFVDYRAEYPFSSIRLIHDPKAFEHALSHALRRLLTGGIVLSELKAFVVRTELPLSPTEIELVSSALRNLGVRQVHFGDEDEA